MTPNPPALFLPFTPVLGNPQRLRAHLITWLADSCLTHATKTVISARFDELVAAVYPTAAPADLDLIAQLIVWMFLLDDQFDTDRLGNSTAQTRAAATQVIAAMHGWPVPEGPVEPALLNAFGPIMRRFEYHRPALWPRIRANLVSFVSSIVREVDQRMRGELPGLEDYLDQRLETFAWAVLVDLLDVACGSQVPARIRELPEYRELVRSAGLVMCAINDLYSLGKELNGQEMHNVVLVIRRETGQDLDKAVASAKALLDDHLDAFQQTASALAGTSHRYDLTTRERQAISTNIDGLKTLMRGQLDWCQTSPRYTAD